MHEGSARQEALEREGALYRELRPAEFGVASRMVGSVSESTMSIVRGGMRHRRSPATRLKGMPGRKASVTDAATASARLTVPATSRASQGTVTTATPSPIDETKMPR